MLVLKYFLQAPASTGTLERNGDDDDDNASAAVTFVHWKHIYGERVREHEGPFQHVYFSNMKCSMHKQHAGEK